MSSSRGENTDEVLAKVKPTKIGNRLTSTSISRILKREFSRVFLGTNSSSFSWGIAFQHPSRFPYFLGAVVLSQETREERAHDLSLSLTDTTRILLCMRYVFRGTERRFQRGSLAEEPERTKRYTSRESSRRDRGNA